MTKEELKAFRLSRGLTQEQFARFVNRVVRTVQNWERGTTPVPDWLEKLR